jgi:hypothetical protein
LLAECDLSLTSLLLPQSRLCSADQEERAITVAAANDFAYCASPTSCRQKYLRC